MRRILIRSGISPLKVVPYEELMNRIGGNVGNLVYAYGVYRMLATDGDVELVSTDYHTRFTASEIERINESCECFVIPLADAIRPDYIKQLRSFTQLVKALRIPCVVIGMGLRAPYEPGEMRYSFDADVRAFIAAVLEKSSCVGVRGQVTGDYLKHLGFREGIDYTVIGCPSLYAFGGDRKGARTQLPSDFGSESKVSFNLSAGASAAHMDFVLNSAREYSQAIYIPQRSRELELMLTGNPYRLQAPKGYPTRISDEFYRSGSCRFFGSARSWIDFLATRDLSFGTRVHGNIVSVLAGTPAVFMPFDARTRELVNYHGFAHLTPKQVAMGGSLSQWLDRIDFSTPEKNHPENFRRYVDFLNRNGIRHIYDDPEAKSDLDRRIAELELMPPLLPITAAEPEEIARRLDAHYESEWNQGLYRDTYEALRRLKWRRKSRK